MRSLGGANALSCNKDHSNFKLYSEVALFEERFYGITAAECNALLPHITSALLITEDDLSGKYEKEWWTFWFYTLGC